MNVKTVNLKGVGDLTVAIRNDKETPSGMKIAEAFGRLYNGLSDLNNAVSGITASAAAPIPIPTVGAVHIEDFLLTAPTTAITPATVAGVGVLLCTFLTQDITGGRLSTWSPALFRWPPAGLNTHPLTISMLWFVGRIDPADSIIKWWTLPFIATGKI